MGRQPKPITDPFEAIAALSERVRKLETSSQLGQSTARGGATKWADGDGTVHVTVGDLGGVVGISSDGGAALGAQRVKLYAQSSDPGASDPDGAIRIWFQI